MQYIMLLYDFANLKMTLLSNWNYQTNFTIVFKNKLSSSYNWVESLKYLGHENNFYRQSPIRAHTVSIVLSSSLVNWTELSMVSQCNAWLCVLPPTIIKKWEGKYIPLINLFISWCFFKTCSFDRKAWPSIINNHYL